MEVTIHEAKTHLSRLIRRVEAGESIVIRRGKDRVALLTAAPPADKLKRNIWGDLKITMADDFDDDLEDFADYMP